MQAYKVIFNNVAKVISNHDPAGLIAGGAPKNEYHDEITKVVSLLKNWDDEYLVGSATQDIFRKSFNEDVKDDDDFYLDLARELIAIKRQFHWE